MPSRDAENVLRDSPDCPLEWALLKALWSQGRTCPQHLVTNYQIMIAGGMAPYPGGALLVRVEAMVLRDPRGH